MYRHTHDAHVVTPISPLLFQPATPATRTRMELKTALPLRRCSLGHATPVRTHVFTARGLQSQSSHQLGSEGEPCLACIGSLPSGTVLTCSSASYAPILRRGRVLYPAPRVLILRRASYDASSSCTAASYPAPPHPHMRRHGLEYPASTPGGWAGLLILLRLLWTEVGPWSYLCTASVVCTVL